MTIIATRTKKERFLPYAYEKSGLGFAIHTVSLDGKPLEALDPEKHVIELNHFDWERAELEAEVTLDVGTLQRVLPELEHQRPPVHAFVAIRCDDTRLRRGVMLMPSDERQGTLEGVIALQRDELRGHAELVPYLVRSRDCTRPAPGFATVKGARLASGRPWEARVDVKAMGTGQYLHVRFHSFAEDGRMPAGNLYWLEAEREDPILWLNSDLQNLAEVLDSRGIRGGRVRIRDGIYAVIAMSVWAQLFMRAAANACSEDRASEYGWEDNVLELLLREMFPDIRDRESRRLALCGLYDGGPAQVLARLDTLLQQRQSLVDHLNRLLSELEET